MMLENITDIVFDDIDFLDYPDFSDAYISSAKYKGELLDTDELDQLNENEDWKYEKLMDYISSI